MLLHLGAVLLDEIIDDGTAWQEGVADGGGFYKLDDRRCDADGVIGVEVGDEDRRGGSSGADSSGGRLTLSSL